MPTTVYGGQTVTLRHATPLRNLISILGDGLLTSKSRGRLKAVWLHAAGRSEWEALHTVARHGGRIEDVVVIEVTVPKCWLKRHGGNVPDMWRSFRDIPMQCFRQIIGFEELAEVASQERGLSCWREQRGFPYARLRCVPGEGLPRARQPPSSLITALALRRHRRSRTPGPRTRLHPLKGAHHVHRSAP